MFKDRNYLVGLNYSEYNKNIDIFKFLESSPGRNS